jgi:NAD+ kinase
VGHLVNVGLVLHPERDSAPAIGALTEWTQRRGIGLLALADEVARVHCTAIPVDPHRLAQDTNLVVSLGGDGTLLRALRLLHAHPEPTPVLGVNLGRLGFLAEIDVEDLPAALTAVDEHRFTVEPRTSVCAHFGPSHADAYNEVALVRTPGRGIAAVALHVDGQEFVRYAADAIIVATPTGSTAYSFSAGGPIVTPTAHGLLVTPASPHSAFNRSLFLSAADALTLEVLPRSGELAVEVDGEVRGSVYPGDRIHLAAEPAAGRLVRLGMTTFYDRARRKLHLHGSTEVD